MSADLQDLHAAVEIRGAYQRYATALQGNSLHLHSVGHHGNRLVTCYVHQTPFSPVLLELQVTHVQNTAEEYVTFLRAGRSHNGNYLSAIFPELLRYQKDAAQMHERN